MESASQVPRTRDGTDAPAPGVRASRGHKHESAPTCSWMLRARLLAALAAAVALTLRLPTRAGHPQPETALVEYRDLERWRLPKA
jgi:hypothetical protein